jgi:hypothetical protein
MLMSISWIIGCTLFFSQILDSIITSERWFTHVIELVPGFGAYRHVPFCLVVLDLQFGGIGYCWFFAASTPTAPENV